jgi:hypothetical protein
MIALSACGVGGGIAVHSSQIAARLTVDRHACAQVWGALNLEYSPGSPGKPTAKKIAQERDLISMALLDRSRLGNHEMRVTMRRLAGAVADGAGHRVLIAAASDVGAACDTLFSSSS